MPHALGPGATAGAFFTSYFCFLPLLLLLKKTSTPLKHIMKPYHPLPLFFIVVYQTSGHFISFTDDVSN